jgi:hypothetical protein
MHILGFIALITFGASLLASGLMILSAIVSSRASAQLAEKYPELHHESAWSQSEHGHDEDTSATTNRSSQTPMVAH